MFCCSSAATIVEAGRDKKNPDEFAVALDETLGDFAFPDEFVFDVWGAIGDAKQGRLEWELCSLIYQSLSESLKIQNDLQMHQNFNNFIDVNLHKYSDLRLCFAKEGSSRNEGKPKLLTTAI